MAYAFIIEPAAYNAFEDEAAQIEQCKEWGLLSDKATKTKAFFYKGNGMNLACSIVGFVDKMTAVIEFDSNQKHCIHPSYLKEMQASNYGQRLTAAVEEAAEPEAVRNAAPQEDIPPVEEIASVQQEASPAEEAPALQEEHAPAEEEKPESPKAEAAPKGRAKKQQLQLPEDKVKMTATVQEFTTVPNNFSDNDDEVIIYEAVSIAEPAIEVGTAWSSHSATLKKLELQVGDTITFEGKIVTKKLTKHPVPYKINNPAKIQKA
ncbi:hypothetical protein FE783_15515 [Paenibacillus mesophilus]|uniref:hypothetical protein n=1 Tax=Paenibacillus mesophilus TaxID=2582849 RepID=UPI00110EE822|nr:hypothetical protein [Paenibacillus mesophilus]TMV49075.1 hypothetical protein FE783_15515 [Paenibacillus mesophilus]